MKTEKQWLFFDRTDISTATSGYLFDESRMSEEGCKEAQVLQDFWSFHMEIGNRHGIAPLRVPFGIRFEPEKAKVSGILFPLDRPWEQGTMGYVSALYDDADGYYKVWYSVDLPADVSLTYADGSPWPQRHAALFARSRDLVNWEKPPLGVLFCEGEDLNAIDHTINEGSLFLDPLHPETGRYKTVNAVSSNDPDKTPLERVDLRFRGSDDGVHFRELKTDPLHYFFDTQNIAYYDEVLGKYVAYLRGHYNGRAIQRAEADELEHMPMPQIIMFPDNEDPMDADYYNNCSTVYPYDKSVRLMFPSIYHHTSDEEDVRMAYSRNGRQFQWVSRDTVIDHHDENGDYFSCAYASPHMFKTDNGVGVMLRSIEWLHNEAYFVHLYRKYDLKKQGVRMATWQKDRLAGIVADEVGEFWLEMKLPKNGKLQVNAKTRGQGRVICEIVPKQTSVPCKGYDAAHCGLLNGDLDWQDIRWEGMDGLPETAEGKTVFLHVRLEKAKIFGVRVLSEEENLTDDGERIVSAHLNL